MFMPAIRNLPDAAEEITEWDLQIFEKLTAMELTPLQIERIVCPGKIFETEGSVLAIHWHPEMVPLPLVETRLRRVYPHACQTLIIPTQHNEILVYGNYAGAEVDCRADAFNRKIQILLHFRSEEIEKAHSLRSMIAHTRQYRQTQLFEFLETLVDPRHEGCLLEAARHTGTEEALVLFTGVLAGKLKRMIEWRSDSIPDMALKNKLVISYINAHREFYDAHAIDRSVIFAAGVKEVVKRRFRLDYFYEVNEIIEEARGLAGGVVVPHPEQFWPVLLADYDVDGYEVWNPQSREFTEFLIQTVIRKNKAGQGGRRLLVMMGDDTHLSEKILDPEQQNPDKAAREIGHQPPWDDTAVRKILNMGDFDKRKVIDEYQARLAGGTV